MNKKIALVTGAMGGIGTAICQVLAKEGMTVLAGCLPSFEPKDAWLAEQKKQGFAFYAAEGDVADYDSSCAMVDRLIAEYGAIDILVNNAGITRDSMFVKMNQAQWDAVIRTNLDSLFNVSHHVVPKMVERGFGRIINIASINGVKGQAGQTNYSAAKAGCIGFSKALAQELVRKGITVNTVAPGYIATEMVMAIREEVRNAIIESVPMKRLGKPEEIGELVRYLASDAAGYITGATININGGMHMM